MTTVNVEPTTKDSTRPVSRQAESGQDGIGARRPGPQFDLVPAGMQLDYRALARQPSPDAYDNVLGEILDGGQVEFPGPNEIVRPWEIVDPLIRAWESGGRPETYARGSWGPKTADDLIATHGGGHWLDSTALSPDEVRP